MRNLILTLALLSVSLSSAALSLPWQHRDKTRRDSIEPYLQQRAIPVYDVDSISFYQSGADKFQSLLADMQQARHHIHCEYFIFANDSIAHRVLDVMRQKAREGVECRLVVDGYYDRQRGYNYSRRLKALRKQGIDVHVYKPYKFPFIHRVLRDHRKIVVIDGRVAYTGGFNVADYNVKGKPGQYGGYVDTHVRLEGQAAEGLQFLFSQHYEQAGGEGFDGPDYYPYTAEGHCVANDQGVAVIERGRQCRSKKKEVRRVVRRLINTSYDSLHITSPYLLPIPSVRHALHRALRRGVHVEVLFSEQGDTPLFNAGNLHYARRLVRQGAEVWLYDGAFQHSKVITADGSRSLVGSVNLDSRAMRWNEEVATLMFDPACAQWLDSSFVASQQSAHPLTLDYYKNLPFSTRIKGFFANYFLSWCL